MVSMTQTLLSVFGSRTVSPSTGLVLNNGIMWFDPEPGKPNSLAPGKRCLMNVCPVLGETGNRRFALGASGGRKIMPAVGQIAAQLLETGASLQEAVEAPRLDVSGGDLVVADERAGRAGDRGARREMDGRDGEAATLPLRLRLPGGGAARGRAEFRHNRNPVALGRCRRRGGAPRPSAARRP
ncbi:gamma-glutamyltransferase [Mangrovicoccus ximenensis]|uniref:gamma-glutamyltransferase n=1 Tax=Mangrovicoccus ximenensis TaxID=1911570 RepID=UPI001F17ACF0|nr:gamma-glutamyltransferase [Mangrovicoccus ximenensis]